MKVDTVYFDSISQIRMHSAIVRKQKPAEGLTASFVPQTALGVRLCDYATLLMRLPAFPKLLVGRYFHDEIVLPEYGMPCPGPRDA